MPIFNPYFWTARLGLIFHNLLYDLLVYLGKYVVQLMFYLMYQLTIYFWNVSVAVVGDYRDLLLSILAFAPVEAQGMIEFFNIPQMLSVFSRVFIYRKIAIVALI